MTDQPTPKPEWPPTRGTFAGDAMDYVRQLYLYAESVEAERDALRKQLQQEPANRKPSTSLVQKMETYDDAIALLWRCGIRTEVINIIENEVRSLRNAELRKRLAALERPSGNEEWMRALAARIVEHVRTIPPTTTRSELAQDIYELICERFSAAGVIADAKKPEWPPKPIDGCIPYSEICPCSACEGARDWHAYALAVERERDALRQWKSDIEEQHRKIMAEPCDASERHCTCVPGLRREIGWLKQEIEEGDYWRERAVKFLELGGCPVCFATDEAGHTNDCLWGIDEKEATDFRIVLEKVLAWQKQWFELPFELEKQICEALGLQSDRKRDGANLERGAASVIGTRSSAPVGEAGASSPQPVATPECDELQRRVATLEQALRACGLNPDSPMIEGLVYVDIQRRATAPAKEDPFIAAARDQARRREAVEQPQTEITGAQVAAAFRRRRHLPGDGGAGGILPPTQPECQDAPVV